MRTQILSAAALVGAVMTFAAPLSAQAACQQFTANNKAHVTAGRAVACGSYNLYACAKGSNQNLGLNNVYTTTTLKEDPAGYFAKGTCPISTGSKPVVGSWDLGVGATQVSASNVVVTDADNDLQSVKLRLTNERTGTVSHVNCPFSPGAPTEYVANSCEIYTATTWGEFTIVPVAQDMNGNVGLGAPQTAYSMVGSSAPTVSLTGHSWNGFTLTVTGTSFDLDNDVTEVTMAIGAVTGTLCQGTTSFTCTFNFEGITPNVEIGLALGAMDSVQNQSDWLQFVVMTPDANANTCVSDKNSNHATAGRATVKYVNLYYANGSNDYLGLATTTTMLKQISAGTWKKVVNCN